MWHNIEALGPKGKSLAYHMVVVLTAKSNWRILSVYLTTTVAPR